MTACCANPGICCEVHTPNQQAALSIALVGNPNCGKTTLFNFLTGARQKVGNWPGVTVERKSGFFTADHQTVEVMDLPGVYSLTMPAESALDECIACQFILRQQADVFVNIVDASHLERHLYLSLQLMEMGVPVVLALNMMDVVQAQGVQIDVAALSRQLGCPVVALQAHKGNGLSELKRAVFAAKQKVANVNLGIYPDVVKEAVKTLSSRGSELSEGSAGPTLALSSMWVPRTSRGMTDIITDIAVDSIKAIPGQDDSIYIRLLEDDHYAQSLATPAVLAQVEIEKANIQAATGEDADILIADARYQFIQKIIQQCVQQGVASKTSWTARIDTLVLNRVLGIPIFLGVMYALFFFAINIGGVFQDFFDISGQAIFVDGLAASLENIGSPNWLIALLAHGIGKGINTTITFIPVIGAMFLFLAFLEGSGYMARAAFVVDRLMRAMGLPGKAFVPMIVGFGCNVPAVMAARTLEDKRDRIITIMMSPFMSCGARLAIYAVFTAAFFPQGGQNVVFALYLIGIFMAVFTGFLLRKTLLKGEPSPLLMEVPSYHMPRMHTMLLEAWQRLKKFVFRAGKLILPISVLIGVLNSLNMDGTLGSSDGSAQSILSALGHAVTPIFAPMGIHADNWPATVGLLTGVLAKEVVIGTLNTLYAQAGQLASAASVDFNLLASMQAALHSIPDNIMALGASFSNPILAKAPMQSLDQGVYGVMYKQFDGQVGAFAYLLFILLYFPCVSTMAVMLRELHRGWAIFSAFWTTGVAYFVAVVFYQAATWAQHPLSSSLWISGLITTFFTTIATVYWLAQYQGNVMSGAYNTLASRLRGAVIPRFIRGTHAEENASMDPVHEARDDII